jgi:ribosomal protein S18 acetylase RimI-like enzyme
VNLEDLKKIDKLNRRSFSGEISHNIVVLRQFYDCFPDFFRVAILEDKVVGYIIGGIVANTENIGFGLTLSTDPLHLRKGIAERLIEDLILQYKTQNYIKLLLTVEPQNKPALSLYKKMGFQTKEKISNYYYQDDKRYLMELIL